jgi:hypothetical protein
MTEPFVIQASGASLAVAAQRKFLELHGTENQMERHLAGLLPEDELLGLARNVLFSPFSGFKRWIKLSPADLMHRRGCRGNVSFTTYSAPDLTADEWARYKTVRDAVSVASSDALKPYDVEIGVDLVEHVGVCEACANECSARSVSIRIEWAGRPLSREYSLKETR